MRVIEWQNSKSESGYIYLESFISWTKRVRILLDSFKWLTCLVQLTKRMGYCWRPNTMRMVKTTNWLEKNGSNTKYQQETKKRSKALSRRRVASLFCFALRREEIVIIHVLYMNCKYLSLFILFKLYMCVSGKRRGSSSIIS